MKKRGFILSTILMFGLFLLLASPGVSNADFTFTNTVTDSNISDSNEWTHSLELDNFDTDLDNFNGVTITSATLEISANVTPNLQYGVYFGSAVGEEDYRIGYIIANETTEQPFVFEILDSSLDALVNNFALNIHIEDIAGGQIDVFQATLTGSAVPIPSVALLIGTAFTGLAMFRRQVFRS